MFYKKITQKALSQLKSIDPFVGLDEAKTSVVQSSLISRLIYDIFGGDIMKTRLEKEWHFYNRINGERLDFSIPGPGISSTPFSFDDIPSTLDETHNYYEEEDYSHLYFKFIRFFEETVGLKRSRFRIAS
jgi:hypothetical protein